MEGKPGENESSDWDKWVTGKNKPSKTTRGGVECNQKYDLDEGYKCSPVDSELHKWVQQAIGTGGTISIFSSDQCQVESQTSSFQF